MEKSPKVSLSPREGQSKCIFCHEALGEDGATYKNCPACSASIHDECDSTGRCLIPGCGTAFEPEKSGAPEKRSASVADRRSRAANPSTVRQPEHYEFSYPEVKGVSFPTKAWLLVAGTLYFAWILAAYRGLSLTQALHNRSVAIGGALVLVIVGLLIEGYAVLKRRKRQQP